MEQVEEDVFVAKDFFQYHSVRQLVLFSELLALASKVHPCEAFLIITCEW